MIYCKCNLNLKKDISGKRFGRLKVIAPAGRTKHHAIVYECLCGCGNKCFVVYRSLTSGATKSCGCLHKEKTSKANSTHGMTRTKTYKIWSNIKRRCLYKHSVNFKRYGGRGITICDRWLDFENFLNDMGEVPTGLQIDRIDNDKGYSPDNCRWVTPSQNCQNTRRNIFLSYQGKKMCIADWSRETGIAARTISYRVSCGYPVEKIFDTSKRPEPKSQYRGVTYFKNTTDKVWRARRSVDGVRKNLGLFRTEEDAYEAYRKAIHE